MMAIKGQLICCQNLRGSLWNGNNIE